MIQQRHARAAGRDLLFQPEGAARRVRIHDEHEVEEAGLADDGLGGRGHGRRGLYRPVVDFRSLIVAIEGVPFGFGLADFEWIQDLHVELLEVRFVSGSDDEVMHTRGGSDHGVFEHVVGFPVHDTSPLPETCRVHR